MNREQQTQRPAKKLLMRGGLGLMCLALAACIPALGKPFLLQVGENAALREGLHVRLVEVLEDSRCPKGATCVWQGQVRVAVEVTTGDGAPVRVELSTLPDKSSADVNGFRIQLQDVAPYPEASRPQPPFEQYTATFVVTRLTGQGTAAPAR